MFYFNQNNKCVFSCVLRNANCEPAHRHSCKTHALLQSKGDLSSWQVCSSARFKTFFHLPLCHSIFPVRPSSFSVYLPLSLLWPCGPERTESFLCHHRCESQLGVLAFNCRLAGFTEERSGTEVQCSDAPFALSASPLLLLPWISHGNETVMRAEQAERCRATFVIFISTRCKGGK